MPGKYTVLDMETLYSKEYSLRKMTPPEYILDPRYSFIGCAVIDAPTGTREFMEQQRFKEFLRELRTRQKSGEKVLAISHNALFDMCLLSWRFGFVPDLNIDTMSMARALVFHETGYVSLDKVSRHLGLDQELGAKTGAIRKVEGMTGADIKAAGLWDEYVEYAMRDADLCLGIFERLKQDFPRQEFLVNDMVIRAATLPRFKLDTNVLHEHLHVTRESKQALLERTGLPDRDALMSNDRFADALRQLGVEPGTKISLTTGKESYAFAKTDQFMIDLEEHENPEVQALAAARMGFKSTLEETRTERFINISQVDWGPLGKEWMPVPLRYSGAHTHRLSGDWKLNLQNLGRSSPLRRALVAPEGHQVVAGDLSQIEARLVAWMAGQDDLVEAFREGRDVYSEFAGEEVYSRTITKADKKERFVGKTSILGLGFGMGGPKFTSTVNVQSYWQLGEALGMPEHEGTRIVQAYRRRYSTVPAAWRALDQLIGSALARGTPAEFGACRIERERVIGPTGLQLYYMDIEQVQGDFGTQWKFTFGRKPKFLFGGKFFENLVQHCARCIIFDAALTLRKRYPRIPLALQVHDELVYAVPDALVDEFREAMEEALTQRVSWAPDLPVACEIGVGPNYGEAK